MFIEPKQHGQVTFQVALTTEQIKEYLPNSCVDRELQFDYKVTPAGGGLNHVEIKLFVQSFSGLKYELDKKIGLDVDYLYQRLNVGTTHQNLFRLKLSLGPMVILSELYEPCNYIDHILSGDLSAVKLYLRDFIKRLMADEELLKDFYAVSHSLVKETDRNKDNQAECDVHGILRRDSKGLTTYKLVYDMVRQNSYDGAYKMNKGLYTAVLGLRESMNAVKCYA